MKSYEGVLEAVAAARRVPEAEVRAHRALRDAVADALAPGVLRVVDAGSFRHDTAVWGASRFDVFVVVGGGKPKSLARVLQGIRVAVQDARIEALVTTTPDSVLVDAVTGAGADADIDALAGTVRLRLIPSYEAPGDAGSAIVAVPDAARRWVLTRPGAREQLLDRIDDADARLRTLIRLVLLWKYRNRVPVSSYYLETAVIRQALRQPSFNLLWDLCWLFEQTAQDDLMNLPDLSSPSQVQRVRAADTLGRRIEAQVPLDAAAAHARAAVNAYLDDDEAAVDAALAGLFGGDVTAG